MQLPLRQYWALFGVYLAPQRGRVALLAVALLGGIGAQLLAPQALRVFVDTVVGSGEARPLLVAAALFLGLALLTQVLGVAASYLGEIVGWQATNALRLELARYCLGLDLAFHNARTPSASMTSALAAISFGSGLNMLHSLGRNLSRKGARCSTSASAAGCGRPHRWWTPVGPMCFAVSVVSGGASVCCRSIS
jgi:ABC-type multidrug transport system fused ATPase/permease subunit